MVPSDFTTASFGEFSLRPPKRSASSVTLPSGSVRVIRREPCSQVMRRPWRSSVLPLALLLGSRQTVVSSRGAHRMILLRGMSLKSRQPWPAIQTGPSVKPKPLARRSTRASLRRIRRKESSWMMNSLSFIIVSNPKAGWHKLGQRPSIHNECLAGHIR